MTAQAVFLGIGIALTGLALVALAASFFISGQPGFMRCPWCLKYWRSYNAPWWTVLVSKDEICDECRRDKYLEKRSGDFYD